VGQQAGVVVAHSAFEADPQIAIRSEQKNERTKGKDECGDFGPLINVIGKPRRWAVAGIGGVLIDLSVAARSPRSNAIALCHATLEMRFLIQQPRHHI
jgi:hypothetical protein